MTNTECLAVCLTRFFAFFFNKRHHNMLYTVFPRKSKPMLICCVQLVTIYREGVENW